MSENTEVPSNNNDNTVVPTVTSIDFKAKQNFFEKKINENIVKFDNKNDMITMCLSLFIHDFAHDFNFQGMFSRILKGNSELYNSFGITIGNNILKYFTVGTRSLTLYNDKAFVNGSPKTTEISEFNQLKTAYNDILKTYEIPETKQQQQTGGDYQQQQQNIIPATYEPINKEAIDVKPILQSSMKQIDNMFLHIPTNSSLTTTSIYTTIIDHFERNPDFLEFFSILKIYTLNYLNSDILTDDFIKKFDKLNSDPEDLDKTKFYNLMMYNAICGSLNYISDDFKTATQDYLDKEKYDIEDLNMVKSHADFFEILLQSYKHIYNKKNTDLEIDSLEILNSSDVLQQFIIYYNFYLTCVDMNEFKQLVIINTQTGGDEDEENEENEDEDNEEEELQKWREPLTEFVGSLHNNLMTTLTRGIFLKTGLWEDFWTLYAEKNKKPKQIPQFSLKTIHEMSYEFLSEIYPIDPQYGGNLNNHFLVIEIVILKQLLLELSPFKMYVMGSKIDDRLKDYMDMFFYNYYGFHDQVNLPYNYEGLDSITNILKEIKDNLNLEFPDIGVTIKPEDESYYLDILFKEPSEEDNLDAFLSERLKLENIFSSYELNSVVIDNLINTTIKPIVVTKGEFTTELNNYFDLLLMNTTVMYKKDAEGNLLPFPIAAPRLKFIINNASNINQNLNGSKLILQGNLGEELKQDTLSKYLDDEGNILDSVRGKNLSSVLRKKQEELDILKDKLKQENSFVRKEKDPEQKKILKNAYKKKLRDQRLPLENEIYLIENIIDELENSEKTGGSSSEESFSKNIMKNRNKWYKNAQDFFGLYKNIKRGVFCPASSMMDAMDNCSLKYGATEPKEVGTTNFQLLFEDKDGNKMSYGGPVIFYDIDSPSKQLTCSIDLRLVCNEDEAVISTNDIQVSESMNLKSNVVYKCVVEKLKMLYKDNIGKELDDLSMIKRMNKKQVKEYMIQKLSNLWNPIQYSVSKENFNKLLGSTALKTLGDFLQECQAVMKWGGYVNNMDGFYKSSIDFVNERNIKPIYRSVEEADTIIPYNENGDALRLGVQGDRPSGFRSIFMTLVASEGINEHCITGYVKNDTGQKQSRTLLVARNENKYDETTNSYGKLIYVTPVVENIENIELESTTTAIKPIEKRVVQEIPSNILVDTDDVKRKVVVNQNEDVGDIIVKRKGRNRTEVPDIPKNINVEDVEGLPLEEVNPEPIEESSNNINFQNGVLSEEKQTQIGGKKSRKNRNKHLHKKTRKTSINGRKKRTRRNKKINNKHKTTISMREENKQVHNEPNNERE